MRLIYRRTGTNKNITPIGNLRSLLMEKPSVDGLLLNEQAGLSFVSAGPRAQNTTGTAILFGELQSWGDEWPP